MTAPSVAVVGGGVTGLSLAFELLQRGARVTVFERAPHLGGLSDTAEYPGFRWDRFYHVIAGSDRSLQGLLQQLGIAGELVFGHTTQGIWIDGRVRPLVSPLDLLRLPGLSLLDKWRLGWFALRGGRPRPAAELDGTTSADWVRRQCGARVWDRLWRHLLRSKLGDAAETAAMRFLHATLVRLSKARGGAQKEQFGYVRGGYARVLDVLERRLREGGAGLRPGSDVQAVQATADGVAVATRDGTHAFDRVAVTVPNGPLADVVRDLTPADRQRLAATPYLGAVVTVVVGASRLSDHYILNLCDDDLALTGVIEMSALVDGRETAGRTLVYLPRYATADSPVFAESDDAIRDRALRDLGKVFPRSREGGWLVHAAVHRARRIQPIPLAGAPPLAPPRVVVPGRVFAVNHAQLSGCVLNNDDCVALARAAADQVLA